MQEMKQIRLSHPDHSAISSTAMTAAQYSRDFAPIFVALQANNALNIIYPLAGEKVASAVENLVACLNRGEGIMAKSDKFMWIFTSWAKFKTMRTILMLFLFFSTSSVFPHQDTPIKLKKNGTLVGLPEKYSPASFSTSDFILEIGKRKISIPECVTSFFTEMDDPTFSFSASWYHSKPILPDYEPLPDYMSLVVSSSVDNQSDVQVLFNLETLEVLEINILQENVTVAGTDYLLYYNEQEISEHCQQEILNSISKE